METTSEVASIWNGLKNFVRIFDSVGLTYKSLYRIQKIKHNTMELEPGHYYHLYNRSNNQEVIFKKDENYRYFLQNFESRFEDLLTVLAYCLMPTHFHFLIKVETDDIDNLRNQIGIHLSSYTKAINKAFQRNGSLFQEHTKADLIDDRSYLITLLIYIHKNPIELGLVDDLVSWPFSSYRNLAGYSRSSLVDCSIVEQYFKSEETFREFSNKAIND